MSLLLNLFLLAFICNTSCLCGSLDNMLDYYETLHHDSMKHEIKKRSIYSDGLEERRLEYSSHGRDFKIHLKKYDSLLSTDFEAYSVDKHGNRRIIPFSSSLYHGTVEGETKPSFVSATLEDDNTWTAAVRTSSEVYMIEPSSRYLPHSSNYSMVAYRASDVKMSNLTAGMRFCSSDNIAEDQQKSRVEGQTRTSSEEGDSDESRSKRSEPSCPGKKYRFCPVIIVADYQFYEKIVSNNYAAALKYLIGLMDQINEIYKEHTFDDCGSGFGFQIRKILIHTEKTADDKHYNSDRSSSSFTTNELLMAFGDAKYSTDFKNFCLAHLFTARSFNDYTLGLSNVAQNSKASNGGICSRSPHTDSGRTYYVNTGWTSFYNSYDDRILSLQAVLVAAHEFGHNWGSHHDPFNNKECSPSNNYPGNYLMYPFSVSGIEPNNKIFSNCSLRAIRDVLKYKARLCFTDFPTIKLCGNHRVEKGETCDEGRDDERKGGVTRCCDSTCHFNKGAVCSDENDLCCENCQFASNTTVCRRRDACSKDAMCTGNMSWCPPSPPREDGHTCMNGGGQCLNGSCVDLCEYNNMTKCICENVNMTCMLCCKSRVNGTCSLYNSTMLSLPDNTSCYMGICWKGVCEKRVTSSLRRLWLYMEIKSIDQLVRFMKDNIVGTVIVLSLICWIPASCLVSFVDYKREKEETRALKWLSITNTLVILEHDRVNIRASTKGRRKAFQS